MAAGALTSLRAAPRRPAQSPEQCPSPGPRPSPSKQPISRTTPPPTRNSIHAASAGVDFVRIRQSNFPHTVRVVPEGLAGVEVRFPPELRGEKGLWLVSSFSARASGDDGGSPWDPPHLHRSWRDV